MRGRASGKTIFAFIGPAVMSLALVGIAPLLYAVWTSVQFFNLTRLNQRRYVGLENYWTVLTDEVFWQAMGRTFAVAGQLAPTCSWRFGLGIALILHRPGLTLSEDAMPAQPCAADGHHLCGRWPVWGRSCSTRTSAW